MKHSRFFLAIFLLICAAQSFACLAQRQPKYEIGLQLYSVRDACEKDFDGVIRAVAKMGYSGVEFAGYYGRSAKHLKDLLKETKLKSYGAHVPLNDLLGDQLAKTIEFHKELGNKFICVPWLPRERLNSKAKILETAQLFNDIAVELKKHGMLLGFHNHAMEFESVEGEVIWDTFFSNTSKDVLIQFDTGNSMSAGVQAAPYLAKHPGRLYSTHVKDFSKTNSNALLGDGEVDWKEVLKVYKSKIGPKVFIIEQEVYPFPSLECAEKNLRTFEKMLGIGK